MEGWAVVKINLVKIPSDALFFFYLWRCASLRWFLMRSLTLSCSCSVDFSGCIQGIYIVFSKRELAVSFRFLDVKPKQLLMCLNVFDVWYILEYFSRRICSPDTGFRRGHIYSNPWGTDCLCSLSYLGYSSAARQFQSLCFCRESSQAGASIMVSK